jgi:hypothetical protein
VPVPLFLVIVPPADETPAGRATEALRRELPARFPEHGFEFMELTEAERLDIPGARDMAFKVLSQRVETADRSEVLAEGPSLEAHLQVSEFVEQTVAATKRRSSN